MRERSSNDGISIHAIAGTEVILLGLDAKPEASQGLLGFRIERRDGDLGPFKPLPAPRRFADVDEPSCVIQAFLWGDYVVDPGTTYTYRAIAVYDDSAAPREAKPVEVTVTTEDPEDQVHAVYFNRGVAGSQAYSRRFGDHQRWYKVEHQGREEWRLQLRPEDIPEREAYTWLSRGLEEAMLGFIAQAKGPEYSLRAAVYEFTYLPAVQAFVDALERGVDVKIVHHAKRQRLLQLKKDNDADTTVNYTDGERAPVTFKNKYVLDRRVPDSVCQEADATLKNVGLKDHANQEAFDQMMIERTRTQISHNKFIVLLKNNKPIQVWTGSTNYTAGGIFGQSNVGHIVRDEAVAGKYFEYWQKLSTDPKAKSSKSDPKDKGMRNWTVLQQRDLKGAPPPNSITPVFSPRLTTAMLDWYANRLAAAASCACFTAAFTVADQIFEKVKKKKRVAEGKPYQRYLLLESVTSSMREKYRKMAKCPQNRIAWGDALRRRGDDPEHQQFIETLTGLNDHVEYLHTKYMLIDPLSDDPVVITGSANFSDASTIKNDENMLIIRGNTRLADIFLGEFMRMFNHFHWRNEVNALSEEEVEARVYLCPDDSWTEPYYTEGTQLYAERLLFA
ncbi:MAG: hypothetical protein JSU63_10735 [Phycisphaerales bacterium]|nr:MAG: hypothetical protein JSU63_10735 [Phycisphaerales bacterium]